MTLVQSPVFSGFSIPLNERFRQSFLRKPDCLTPSELLLGEESDTAVRVDQVATADGSLVNRRAYVTNEVS